jgi:prepilin-type N-terminal cleavage/methylation domain-containing protein
MRNLLQKRKSEGFTIIEVMIVLAIAGLILLIVFLAVPALQRNAHNTSIKNDVAGLLGGVNEYANNNNGIPPATFSSPAVNQIDAGAAGSNVATVKLGYIDGTTGVTLAITAAPAGAIVNGQTPATVHLYSKATCNGNGKDGVGGGTARNVIALYGLEGGAKICQAS